MQQRGSGKNADWQFSEIRSQGLGFGLITHPFWAHFLVFKMKIRGSVKYVKTCCLRVTQSMLFPFCLSNIFPFRGP